MRKVIFGMLLSGLTAATLANPPILIDSQRGKFLGNLGPSIDPDSIYNPVGQYGSPVSPDSINNPGGQYGSPVSPDSPNNPLAPNTPVLIHPYGD